MPDYQKEKCTVNSSWSGQNIAVDLCSQVLGKFLSRPLPFHLSAAGTQRSCTRKGMINWQTTDTFHWIWSFFSKKNFLKSFNKAIRKPWKCCKHKEDLHSKRYASAFIVKLLLLFAPAFVTAQITDWNLAFSHNNVVLFKAGTSFKSNYYILTFLHQLFSHGFWTKLWLVTVL